MVAEEYVEDTDSLEALIARSPVMADAAVRRHWQWVVPHLPVAARYELASILLDVQRACET